VHVRAGHGLAPVDAVLVAAGADRGPLGGERRAHHRGQGGVERDGQRPLLGQRGAPSLSLAEAGFGLAGLLVKAVEPVRQRDILRVPVLRLVADLLPLPNHA
jgi:hypothetical protein